MTSERTRTLDSMKRKAKILADKLNEIEGVNCMPIEGAMYAFPEITLPQKYVEHCRNELKKEPDTVYALEILKKLGVVVVPGNGFGQRKGTYHFRITILPPEDDLVRILDELKAFQEGILKEWGGSGSGSGGMKRTKSIFPNEQDL